MASVKPTNYTIPNNYSIERPTPTTNWTTAKIKQYAMYAFAILLAFAIIGACLFVPAPYTLLPTPLSAGVIGLTYSANQIKDYENPRNLLEFKARAEEMTFQKLHDEFGLKNVLKYELVSSDALKEKFLDQIQDMSFSLVAKSYDFEDLLQLTNPGHVALLKRLTSEENRSRGQLSTALLKSQDEKERIKARAQFNDELNKLDADYALYKKNLNVTWVTKG